MMRRPGAVHLSLVVLAALLVVALDAAGIPVGPLRAIAGLFLAALAPGLALILAVRPRFLAVQARIVLAVPVSLAMLATLGAVLDHTPVGIEPTAMLVASGVLTALLCLVGVAREWRSGHTGLGLTGGVHGPRTRAAGPSAGSPRAVVSRLGEQAIAHLRDPLFRNGYALAMSGVITSGLGVVYWAVAARLFSASAVGVGAALLSLVTLLANVSQLNLRSALGRFVPIAGRRAPSLVYGGYLAAAGLALVTGIAVVLLLVALPGIAGNTPLSPLMVWLFPLTVLLWTLFTVQDHVLVALRRTPVVPLENGVFALVKIVLLVPLAAMATADAILLSWAIPTAIGVMVVSTWILVRLVPRLGGRPSAPAGNPEVRAALEADAPEADVRPRTVVRFIGGDYVGSLFAIGASSILPVLVLSVLGAATSAHFYIVSLIAAATQLVPTVLATSLLVEVASSNATFEGDGRRVLRLLFLFLAPLVLVLFVLAGPVLSIFGASYAAEGATTLRLLALAGIPYALVNLAFIRLRLDGRVRVIVIVQALLAAGTVIPTLLLLPVLGIAAIGVATLVSQSVAAVLLARSELRSILVPRAGRRPGAPGHEGAGEASDLGPQGADSASATARA